MQDAGAGQALLSEKLARAKTLPTYDKLTSRKRRGDFQSGDEVLSILRGLQARGAAMTIRRIDGGQ